MGSITRYWTQWNKVNVLHQYCYVHLLRDIKKEKEAFPEEPEVQCFCLKLSALLKKAIGMFGSEDNLYSYSEAGIENQRANHGNMPSSGTASCGSIFAEYFPYKKEDCLFQWIRSPHIPCENNNAERALHPLAVTGKISYGSQSERGMKPREIPASVLHTAAARGLEPAAFLEAFLNDSRNASLLFSWTLTDAILTMQKFRDFIIDRTWQ